MTIFSRIGAASIQGARRSRLGGVVQLDLFSGGTFTRSSEASYLTGAPTDGSSAYLAWATSNVRRVENRGDGNGDLLLLEGSRSNGFQFSEDFSQVNWFKTSATITADAANSPDGTANADLFDSSANTGRALDALPAGIIPDNVPVVLTCYARSLAGGGSQSFAQRFVDRSNSPHVVPATITETWSRMEAAIPAATGGTSVSGGPANDSVVIVDSYVWGAQIEHTVYWPSSYIRTTSTQPVTRSTDVLSYASGAYPASFLTSGFVFTFYPDFSSAEHVSSGSAQALCGGGISSDWLRLNAGAASLTLLDGGAGMVTATGLSWSRYQPLTIEVRPSAGQLVLSGFTTGDNTYTGTSWTWDSTAFYVGSRATGINNTFGRFGRYITAL